MKEPLAIKVAALTGSLLGYYMAKANQRETLPMMMVGGLIGGALADWIIPTPQKNAHEKEQ